MITFFITHLLAFWAGSALTILALAIVSGDRGLDDEDRELAERARAEGWMP